jgi:hypothetical protein
VGSNWYHAGAKAPNKVLGAYGLSTTTRVLVLSLLTPWILLLGKTLFEGFSGYMVGANYTVAKNMIAGVEYFDLKGKESDNHDKTLWGQMLVTF